MCDTCGNPEHNLLTEKRHSLAHLLAAAVSELYPEAQLTLGPAVDNGFYYDIDFGENKIGDTVLPKIEKRMKRLLPTWTTFEAEKVSTEKALETYAGNPYKSELIEEIAERGEQITLYTSGKFTDLCRGGHIENMKESIKADTFTLDRVAGAYWRGDESRPMLTRIYGLAFDTKEELDTYREKRDAAKDRDHRKIGKELDLFTFSDLVGPGLPLFTPKGTIIRDLIMDKIMGIQKSYGYQKVATPHITKPELYRTSGHWEKFGDELFKITGKSGTEMVMKPMNCPHHTQIYASQSRSYRDLPLRYMELGVVYRDEQAGELLGLSRVRSISQDDGHVFCRPDQIGEEVGIIIKVIKEFFDSLGMLEEGNYWVSLSVRDPETPEKYLGGGDVWDTAEAALESIAKEHNLDYKRVEGEAAFYGPKLDFQFYDALGRERQLGTAQLDFNMPRRFELEYTDSDGSKQTPVMIHRAVAGSLERFMAVMIEHFAGHFPLWLAPVQIALLPVNPEAHGAAAQEIAETLRGAGFRVDLYDAADSLGKRIRSIKQQKIPYQIVIGDEEIATGKLTAEGREDKLENLSIEELIKQFKNLST
jgi:threonyl-tRNA synthetase